MRWRTSMGADGEVEGGAAAPLDAEIKPENEQHETNYSGSSPLVEQGADSSSGEGSLAASSLMMNSSDGNGGASSMHAIETSYESSSAVSQSSPDGDPPYKRSQQTTSPGKDGGEGADSNDQEDMPGLEAVNPDDGDDDDTGDDHEVPWKPQATQSTCEFTHIIANYSQKRDSGCKKAEYSATTIDEFGNRWRLIVYVNGNGRASNHHLSLFLQVADADDLPFGWKKAVSYVLTLEHPTGGNLSYAKRNPDKTFKLCPKAIDWGWSQFITSDRIQQEGFVQDDSLIVRASVTVKSSSVSIDLEDAELYLKCAVEEGKPDAVQLCLDQGASVNCQFKDDLYTPLHTACSTSTGDDEDDEDEDDSDSDGDHKRERTALAATSGGMQVLRLLLEKGADGNACNKWRETPLLIAANNGHRAAVEALLEHGADPSLCSEAGWSALTFAAHKGYDDIVELLLKAGAPVNCRVTEDASTPLHKACAGSKPGHLAAVSLLLANDADVHALNKWRETPLLTAANHGQAGAVDALLKSGADPCKCTDTGWSPLSIAAYKGHDDVVKLLLDEGAPTEEADPTLSALLQAATKGLPETVELLLRHGADHTVTTKKGDTALSILVEQNLIDAAADMVTEYNASIPRCSRDRKKVQRARLLVNLKIKQRQREGRDVQTIDSDDDEPNDDSSPSYVADETPNSASDGSNAKKKKKNKKRKSSAEQEAKAAEEALLAELEMEDAERQKQENEANKKSAKKKKKKERERQLKKEQEEKRLAEEREKEEKLRKERDAREAKERAERERLAAIKRKEEEAERQRILQQQKVEQAKRDQERRKALERRKDQQKQESLAVKVNQDTDAVGEVTKKQPGNQQSSTKASNPVRTAQPSKGGQPKLAINSSSTSTSKTAGKNRGWETKPATPQAATSGGEGNHTPSRLAGSGTSAPGHFRTPPRSTTTQAAELFRNASGSSPFPGFSDRMNPPQPGPISFTKSEPMLNGFAPSPPTPSKEAEVPAIALFRRNKVSELLQRCAASRASGDALGIVKEGTLKRVLYRWVVRAAHEAASYLDCIIPSWTDHDKLSTFFQRQFISESRKGHSTSLGSSMVSIESLKEAGSAMASICHRLAKEVADFRVRVEQELPMDWNDAIIGMKASDMLGNASVPEGSVVLDWANRAQVFIPRFVFGKLQERYKGLPGRLLSSMFSTQIRYETQQLLTAETLMDFSLPADTLVALSAQAHVSAELWSNPMTAAGGNIFWGQFDDIDFIFGGRSPFGKNESNDAILARHGGSAVAVVPLDSMVASVYMNRMLELMDQAENLRVPLSFFVVLRSECFLDGPSNPSLNDLYIVEPRLRDRGMLLSHVNELMPKQHGYFCTKSNRMTPSDTGSLVVLLQNSAGRAQHGISENVIAQILRSMSASQGFSPERNQEVPSLPLMSEMSFSAPEFVPAAKPISVGGDNNDFFSQVSLVGQVPASSQQNSLLPDFGTSIGGSDFGGFGVAPIGNSFGSVPASRSTRPGRGRLFDLVDDGGEDDTADVVSGMLGNLNMDDLFSHQPNRNSNGEMDIDAISLMGIGGPTPSSSTSTSNNSGMQTRRGPFGY